MEQRPGAREPSQERQLYESSPPQPDHAGLQVYDNGGLEVVQQPQPQPQRPHATLPIDYTNQQSLPWEKAAPSHSSPYTRKVPIYAPHDTRPAAATYPYSSRQASISEQPAHSGSGRSGREVGFCGMRRQAFLVILVILIFIAVVAIALGVGLGIGLKQPGSSGLTR